MPKQQDFGGWGDRNPLRGLAKPVTGDGQPALAPSVLDLISGKQKKPRGRDWEKRNRACSYTIPTPLHSAAIQVRGDIVSIAQFDPDGKPRNDGTTVDDVARILMDWALTAVQKNPELLAPRLNAHSRKGQMTVSWEAWEGWSKKTPIQLKEPVLHRKKTNAKKCVLSFRWGSEIDARVKKVAGVGMPSESVKNPLKFAIPVSELVVSLLLLGISGYVRREFNLTITVKAVTKADSWE